MPQSRPSKSLSLHGYRVLYAGISAIIAFAGIGLVVSRLGLEPLAAGVFAFLSASATAGFVWRERTLLGRLSVGEAEAFTHSSNLHARKEYWYDRSSLALLKYDASTLIVIRMGAGCAELLGIESTEGVTGMHLDNLLGADASILELINNQIREARLERAATVLCRCVDGTSLELSVSGVYLPEEHAVEVALVRNQRNFGQNEELQDTMEDLERFRKGMVRRERRILDLKAEVNELLISAKQEPRYSIDSNTSDRKVHSMSTHNEEADQES